MAERWFEDYVPGSIHELGSITMDEGELLEFARKYDPQPMHTDPEAAAKTQYGSLIASGWHTVALMMRLLVTEYLSPASSLGSPGVDELRWSRPVRPGDVLAVRVTVEEARVSSSKPDRGIVRSRTEVTNQHGETVMTVRAANFVLRNPAG
ncbi:MAG TPA: MaoC family dehydratase [Gammaproteobacteria bacterium]|nr:MaoC family dehydratase [Gammaproteobacteria bacterium]